MKRLWWLAWATAAGLAAADAGFDRFVDRLTREWVKGDPLLASQTQMLDGPEQDRLERELPAATREAQRERERQARQGLAELKRFDPAPLDAGQRLSARILRASLERVLAAEPFNDHGFVFNQMSGFQNRLTQGLTNLPMRRERDAQNYLARLSQVGTRLDEGIAEARRRERAGFVPPKAILTLTVEQMKRFIAPEPGKNPLVATFVERLDKVPGLTAGAREDLRQTAEGTVRNSVYPAFRRVIALLEAQGPKAPGAVGLGSMKNGVAAYAEALRRHTSGNLTPEEVHQTGRREVARIEREINRVLAELGETEGPREERIRRAQAKRPGVYPAGPEGEAKVLADYRRIMREAERRADEFFDLRPKAPVDVKPVEAFRLANAAAHYTFPALDGSRPGLFWVPLRGQTFTASRTLAYHEAVPGHHFQLALQQENQALPKFRRDPVFGLETAFVEGWALYVERMVWEEGWYRGDPHGELDYLVSSALFRARRLVVDTGLHAKGWTIEQGVAYGISRNEVERYVTMPGQACSYMMGALRILELRERLKRELGAGFSLKEFHNLVLRGGAMPLEVLASVAEEWVAEKRR